MLLFLTLTCLLMAALPVCGDEPPSLAMTATVRKSNPASGQIEAVGQTLRWDPKRTAIIICDMWDKHWCQGATARVAEMAPVMNKAVQAARKQGVFIIHAPSDTMDFYRDTPQRRRAQEAPKASFTQAPTGWCSLDPAVEGKLPIDDSDGGCDSEPPCKQYKAWKSQTPLLEIADVDAITDQGPEVFNLLQQRGIEKVILMGVHVNMCVLGRPFGIRQMVRQGKNVVLMRDLTDAMYNPRRAPQASHFRGTELVVEHIEQHWCPTVTSSVFTGAPAFRFKGAE